MGLLLTVFINDLLSSVPVPAELYADDAFLYQTLQRRQRNNGIEQLQRGLTAASAWASSWKGRFGPVKTISMPISSSSAPPVSSQPELKIESQVIQTASVRKHLGIMLSSDLRWSHHMNKIILEGSKRAGLLRLMARDLPSSVIIKLYLYYLRPSLEYASPFCHRSISSSHAMALERIQASVARCFAC